MQTRWDWPVVTRFHIADLFLIVACPTRPEPPTDPDVTDAETDAAGKPTRVAGLENA